jgi:hypothetical protein
MPLTSCHRPAQVLAGRVFGKFHRPLAWLTLFAWLSASGLSWDALQVVAWAKMSVDNARDASIVAAVGKTLADAPCPLCRVAQEGRKQSEQSPPAGQELAKAKVKTPQALGELGLVAASFEAPAHGHPVDEVAVVRAVEVPVPPPKARV